MKSKSKVLFSLLLMNVLFQVGAAHASLSVALHPNNAFQWPSASVIIDTTGGDPLTDPNFSQERAGIKEGRAAVSQELTFTEDAIITDLWLVVSGGEDGSPGQLYFDGAAVAGGDFVITTAAANDDANPSSIHLNGLNLNVTAGTHTIGFTDTGSSTDADFVFGWNYSTADPYAGGDSSVGSGRDMGIAVVGTSVPEPSSTALLGLGSLALILRRRKN